MPGPSKRTERDHKLSCRVMRAEKGAKKSKDENVRLKGVVMATQPTKSQPRAKAMKAMKAAVKKPAAAIKAQPSHRDVQPMGARR